MDQLIVDLPFAFKAEIIPPRHSKGKVDIYHSFVTVGLACVSADQAPVALEVIRHQSYQDSTPEDRARFYPNGPSRTVFREYDGKLFVPFGDTPLPAQDLEAACSVARQPAFSPYRYPRSSIIPAHESSRTTPLSYRNWDAVARELWNKKGRLVWENKEECGTEARWQLTNAFLVIDGKVWTTTGADEPTYRVSLGAQPSVEITFNAEPISYTAHYPVDQRAAAMAAAKLSGRKFEITQDEVIIHRPEAVRRDGVILAAQQALACLCVSILNRNEGWSIEAESEVGYIRNIRSMGENLDLPHAVAVLEGFERLEGLFAGFSEETDAGEMMRRVAPVLRRWREVERPNRPDLEEMEVDPVEGIFAGL